MGKEVTVFWFRRDLRLDDNMGLYYAYNQEKNVLPLFIFDTDILNELDDKQDARVQFIHERVSLLHEELREYGGSILIQLGKPLEVFRKLTDEYNVSSVYTNRDYEPYAKKRDEQVRGYLVDRGISFFDFKDQVIFEKDEIMTDAGQHYKVFTPYSKNWRQKFNASKIQFVKLDKRKKGFFQTKPFPVPTLKNIGFEKSPLIIPPVKIDTALIRNYDQTRDYPSINGTSRLGIHLRFGSISIRKLVAGAAALNEVFLNELIWRDFYTMILYHNPGVIDKSFKSEYDKISWRNDEKEFAAWCHGKTGYPLVDAGMRELNNTGYMHNRVRMVAASFLTKHLLIDWRWGEAYFAKKLLDYELASNNGGWQWAAGTGTDAQPYFRIFNPASQLEKFDKDHEYVKKWVPEWGTPDYPKPIVDHKFARRRALITYQAALDR